MVIFGGYETFSIAATRGKASRKMRNMQIRSAHLLLVVLFGVAAGCSRPAAESPPGAGYVATPAPSWEADAIAEWVEKGISVNPKLLMIKSESHDNVYWVAARLHGPGLKNSWAMFAHAGTALQEKDASSVFAADAIAREFSDAPIGSQNKSGAWAADNPEARWLQDYVQDIEPNDSKYLAGAKLVPGRSKGRK